MARTNSGHKAREPSGGAVGGTLAYSIFFSSPVSANIDETLKYR